MRRHAFRFIWAYIGIDNNHVLRGLPSLVRRRNKPASIRRSGGTGIDESEGVGQTNRGLHISRSVIFERQVRVGTQHPRPRRPSESRKRLYCLRLQHFLPGFLVFGYQRLPRA